MCRSWRSARAASRLPCLRWRAAAALWSVDGQVDRGEAKGGIGEHELTISATLPCSSPSANPIRSTISRLASRPSPTAQQGGRSRESPPPSLAGPAHPLAQYVIIDSIVYDLTKFIAIHPGGRAALLDKDIAGKDATAAFFGLHRSEVLWRPQYAKLRIGRVQGAQQLIKPKEAGSISHVSAAGVGWRDGR